jgi:hypothetical protein
MATMYAAIWRPFDLTVYVRTFDSFGALALPLGIEQRIETNIIDKAGRIRGGNLGDIIDVGRIGPNAFQVVRLPPGELLTTVLDRDGTLEAIRVGELLTDVAAAMRICREKALPFRAPTPNNLWMARDSDVLLLGAGEALYREDSLQMSAAVTPELICHVPPEAFRFAPQTTEADGTGPMRRFSADDSLRLRALEDSPAAEVYALGCLAYQCLIGHHPFFINPVDTTDGISATLRDDPAQIELLDEHGPVADVVLRALSREPENRPATPEAFAAEFRAALEGRHVTIHRTAAHPVIGDDDEHDVFVAAPVSAAVAANTPEASSLWRFSTIVLLAGVTLALALGQLRKDTIVITSNPPGVLLQEVVGHVGVDRGRTPVFLHDRTLAMPIRLQTVTGDGVVSDPIELQPRLLNDLGRCRSIELQLNFDRADAARAEEAADSDAP